MKSTHDLLLESPFFETLGDRHLQALAEQARLESYPAGSVIIESDRSADALYVLVTGKVELGYEGHADAATTDRRGGRVTVRTIAEPGRVLGWSAMVEPYHYHATVVATEDTQVLALDRDWLEAYVRSHPRFGVGLMERIIWVLGARLRETRIRLVAQRYDEEVLAIRALLEQSADELCVDSPLHKIPHYLENRVTISDAFHTLELLRVHGDELERNLATLCVDILEHVRRELTVYQQLQSIYEHVASSPIRTAPTEVRERCCEEFVTLFRHTDYIIEGEERLPERTGCIFVMNHLDNHPQNALPNNFRLTLDTHFVASMIVHRRYGRAPVRVIRKSNPNEFGHQKYYDRLGYIYVYNGLVDEDVEDPGRLAEERNRKFFAVACSHLLDGDNLIICPEGACTTSEKSPLPFKAGAFRLARMVRPEPWIVPVAVANFDKKVTRARLAAIVEEPFKLSERVADADSNERLYAFVNDYQRTFAGYVDEARRLAASRVSTP